MNGLLLGPPAVELARRRSLLAPGRGIQVGHTRWPCDTPFTGIPTFLRSRVLGPEDAVEADMVVLGAPTHEGSPFVPGSRLGPCPGPVARSGCVSAEPDGMSYSQLKEAPIALADRARAVGFDLVEVNPQLDAGRVPPHISPPTPSWSSLATCATARNGRPSASALQAPRHQGDQVVEDVGGGDGSDLGVIVGRRDLDYVASDDSHCIEPAQ
jgi:hypothetical protein